MRVDVGEEVLSIAHEVGPYAVISVWLRNGEANRSINPPHVGFLLGLVAGGLCCMSRDKFTSSAVDGLVLSFSKLPGCDAALVSWIDALTLSIDAAGFEEMC